MNKWPTISWIEAKTLIEQKKIRLAYLYEPDHAPKDTKFVFVDFGAFGKRFYRYLGNSCKES